MTLFFILSILLVLILSGCVSRYEYEQVNATIIDKNYTAEYTTTMPILCGKVVVLQTQYHSATYNLMLKFEDVTTDIDSETLYNAHNVGDTIQVYLRKGYNDENILEESTLVLDKEN